MISDEWSTKGFPLFELVLLSVGEALTGGEIASRASGQVLRSAMTFFASASRRSVLISRS